MRFDCVAEENQARAHQLERAIGVGAVRAHAAMAEIATAAAEFDELGAWSAPGFRSFDHWLAVEMGFDPHIGRELSRVGKALRELPLLAAAFGAGRLSFDKVREVTTVATPETDELMLEIARGASGAQVARICRSLRRMTAPESQQHQAQRGLWMRFTENGMVRLVANLPAEEAAIVQAAIESLAAKMPLPEDADEPHAARRADALAGMCKGAGVDTEVVVHVDVDGRCGLEKGAPLPVEAARRLGCDAEIVPVVERDGLPIDVGRRFRTAPPKLRQALEIRDRFCRFPGCPVPAKHTDAHHHNPWILGGNTNLGEMLLLCRYHHRIYHEGGYRILKVGDDFRFETNDGHVMGASNSENLPEAGAIEPGSAAAEWGCVRMDYDHTMFVLGQYFGPTEARAGPS